MYLITGLTSGSNQHQQAAEENRQAIILFSIVVLFFICHLFRNLLSLHEALKFEQKKSDYFHGCGGMPFGILVVGLLSHLLLSCNSAFNFFLYCAMSDQFRTELKKVLRIKPGNNNNPRVARTASKREAGEDNKLHDADHENQQGGFVPKNIANVKTDNKGVNLMVTQELNGNPLTTRMPNNVLTTSL